nr:breast carcinoma-amplified sequence 3 homolog [Ciona intestinalis]|eukprot:XP_002121003.3 breast carcinoma-amplified sequence 3 homolog [Ciona intestinalis]
MSGTTFSGENKVQQSNRRRMDSSGGRCVKPEPANGKSYMESVYNFIHDLSQAYTKSAIPDEKDTITWARFCSYPDAPEVNESSINPPMLLLLGYSNGIQMWNLQINGDAQEVFSLRDGPVKTACVLPPPPASDIIDQLQEKRPLIAICLAANSKQMFAQVTIRSLRSGDQVKRLDFPSDVISLHAGPAPLLLVALKESVHGFDARTLTQVFILNGCHPSGGFIANPISLGRRWLAYSPSIPLPGLQSSGGVAGDGVPSYVATVISAAKTIGKGISTFSDTVNWLAAKSHLTGTSEEVSQSTSVSSQRDRSWGSRKSTNTNGSVERGLEGSIPGLVSIIDLQKFCNMKNFNNDLTDREMELEVDSSNLIAHFVAHAGHAVSLMEQSACGRLLATADQLGHAFHVFSVLPHPCGPTQAAVHHLYTLRRGDTSAQVQELRFSWDSRWLCASTRRGTCHVFPVAPYGGNPIVRTHISDRLVNRSSRFHKSAGLDDIEYTEPTPIPTYRPLSDNPTPLSQGILGWQTHHRVLSPRSLTSSNPRLPPLPHPVLVNALAHVRLGHATSVAASLPAVLPTQSSFMTSSTDANVSTSLPTTADVVIASHFLNLTQKDRSVKGAPTGGRNVASSAGCQKLLVVSSSGFLTEYLLEPRPQHGLPKVSDDSPVELLATARLCWPLQRLSTWSIVSLPIPIKNELLAMDDHCRQLYELHRMRSKSNEYTTRPQNVSDVTATISSKNPVKSEQPKRSRPFSAQQRNAVPGSAVPRGQPKAKKSSSMSEQDAIRMNGRHGSDEERKRSKSDAGVASVAGDEWLAQVEMVTHEGPARRLWMGPQFNFKPLLSTSSTHVLSSVSSALLSNQQHLVDGVSAVAPPYGGAVSGEDVYNEELDIHSLPIHSRSEPVPTPAPRYAASFDDGDISSGCCTTLSRITIESGSGNFDRAAHMLEINAYGSLEDRRLSGYTLREGEERLKERIADAMVDLYDDVTNQPTMTSSTPFPSTSPVAKYRADSDTADYGVDLVTEHFEFSRDAPSIQLPSDV